MPRTVVSVSLDSPASDPNINETQTFSMDGTITDTGSHALDFDVHWQWDQGTSTWTNLTSSGALSTADTNPVNNETNANLTAITVTGNTAGTYSVRIRTVDHNDGDNEDLSPTQTVTVNAASSRRRNALV